MLVLLADNKSLRVLLLLRLVVVVMSVPHHFLYLLFTWVFAQRLEGVAVSVRL